MIAPQLPDNEKERLDNLKDYQILDTIPEKDYDDITMLASEICKTQISLVSFIDDNRQWFKSVHGLEVRETPREYSFCAHAINKPNELLIVSDTTKDPRFSDNPFVIGHPFVHFYAGVPLVSPQGYALGSLCVIDKRPKKLSTKQIKALRALGNQVIAQLEYRKNSAYLCSMFEEMTNNYREIEQFSYIAAHDLKSPLNNIIGMLDTILNKENILTAENKNVYLSNIKESSKQIVKLFDGIVEYSKANQLSSTKKEEIDLPEIIHEITETLNLSDNVKLQYNFEVTNIRTSLPVLKQVLINLLNNSLKNLTDKGGTIKIQVLDSEMYYNFLVEDNITFISAENIKIIFDLFKTIKLHKNAGTGISLSLVRKLVKKLGGDIAVNSIKDEGTIFQFTVKK